MTRVIKSAVTSLQLWYYRFTVYSSAYVSYTELTLTCKSATNENYPLLQAAYLGKAGNNLVNTLTKVKTTDDILFAVFSKSSHPDSLDSAPGSALCAYPVRKLNKIIKNGLQECFYAEGTRGLEHMSAEGTQDCIDNLVSLGTWGTLF